MDAIDLDKLLLAAPYLLLNGDLAPIITRELLSRIKDIQVSHDCSEVGIKQSRRIIQPILRILTDHLCPTPIITQLIIDFLACSEDPLPFIENMSALVGDTEEEVQAIVELYKELVVTNRKCLVPIIGSLSDMSLSNLAKDEVFLLSSESLSVVEERDFPVVVRTLLRSANQNNVGELIRTLRQHFPTLSTDISPLVLEILCDVMRINQLVLSTYLASIDREGSTLSAIDFCLLLNILSHNSSLSEHATQSLYRSFCRGTLSLDKMLSYLQLADLLRPYGQSIVVFTEKLFRLAEDDPALHPWIDEWARRSHEIFAELRRPLVSCILSQCLRKSERSEATVVAAKILYKISEERPSHLSSFSYMIEEIIHHYSSLPSQDFHILCATLANLSRQPESNVNSLMIYVQKQIFCGNLQAQRCAVVCATHILHSRSMLSLEIESVLSWIERYIDSSEGVCRLVAVDLILYNVDSLPEEVLEGITDGILRPKMEACRILMRPEDVKVEEREVRENPGYFEGHKSDRLLYMRGNFKRISECDRVVEFSMYVSLIYHCWLNIQLRGLNQTDEYALHNFALKFLMVPLSIVLKTHVRPTDQRFIKHAKTVMDNLIVTYHIFHVFSVVLQRVANMVGRLRYSSSKASEEEGEEDSKKNPLTREMSHMISFRVKSALQLIGHYKKISSAVLDQDLSKRYTEHMTTYNVTQRWPFSPLPLSSLLLFISNTPLVFSEIYEIFRGYMQVAEIVTTQLATPRSLQSKKHRQKRKTTEKEIFFSALYLEESLMDSDSLLKQLLCPFLFVEGRVVDEREDGEKIRKQRLEQARRVLSCQLYILSYSIGWASSNEDLLRLTLVELCHAITETFSPHMKIGQMSVIVGDFIRSLLPDITDGYHILLCLNVLYVLYKENKAALPISEFFLEYSIEKFRQNNLRNLLDKIPQCVTSTKLNDAHFLTSALLEGALSLPSESDKVVVLEKLVQQIVRGVDGDSTQDEVQETQTRFTIAARSLKESVAMVPVGVQSTTSLTKIVQIFTDLSTIYNKEDRMLDVVVQHSIKFLPKVSNLQRHFVLCVGRGDHSEELRIVTELYESLRELNHRWKNLIMFIKYKKKKVEGFSKFIYNYERSNLQMDLMKSACQIGEEYDGKRIEESEEEDEFSGLLPSDSSEDDEEEPTDETLGFHSNVYEDDQTMSLFETEPHIDFITDDCHRKGVKFTDASFPPSDTSLYRNVIRPPKLWPKIDSWARIPDILENPVMFHDENRPGDVIEGVVKDAWLLGGCSAVTTKPDIFLQCFSQITLNDVGAYEFALFKNGRWIYVCVDDYVPLSRGKLVFSRCARASEVWAILLEKAYAKLHGCYENLEGGNECHPMVDLTGATSQVIQLDQQNARLDMLHSGKMWNKVVKWHNNGFILSCIYNSTSIKEKSNPQSGKGLIQDHLYSIIRVTEIDQNKLVQLRNPWIQGEWRGPWSRGSKEWTGELVSLLGENCEQEGTFWMEFSEWCRRFSRLNVVRLLNEHWNGSGFEDEWTMQTAGGSANFPSWKNGPQFGFELTRPTKVIISLSQKDARLEGSRDINYDIGFILLFAQDRKSRISQIKPNDVVGTTPFTSTREVSKKFKLDAGSYVVAPSTAHPHKLTRFYLRVFVESDDPIDMTLCDALTDTSITTNKLPTFRNGKAVRVPSQQGVRCSEEALDTDVPAHFKGSRTLKTSFPPRENHPLYTISSSQYGLREPSRLEKNENYFGRSNQFTIEQGGKSPFRNFSLTETYKYT
ncbi:hypothetical protein PROFUN_06973 [Planoprotostelium fungivorum]|uniref:Calpain catalytic domain-containing protein n=1 Tax=Planoprotostelium fungivorum TaxID=1890364 RepID=A0A2P6NNA3_9EUKA|nr:hypothetical protein PROFUN_06973 [Planoprotostelium fungivorum]